MYELCRYHKYGYKSTRNSNDGIVKKIGRKKACRRHDLSRKDNKAERGGAEVVGVRTKVLPVKILGIYGIGRDHVDLHRRFLLLHLVILL